MESEGEAIPLQDIGNTESNVVVRRQRASTSTTRRNVAIIEGTLISVANDSIHQDTLLDSEQQGENYYHIDREFEQDTEDHSVNGRITKVSSPITAPTGMLACGR